MHLILASTSPYRRTLLERLQIPFLCEAPDVDETPLLDEHPAALSQRLSLAKASSVATLNPTALVIGSDQVASIDGNCIGKPGNFENAATQLRASSGRRVDFYTGIALVGRDAGIERVHMERFSVQFRELSDAEITRYLEKEQPYDCAGSFKAEGLGVSLFRSTEGPDVTSLIGLPLIRLVDMLNSAGLELP